MPNATGRAQRCQRLLNVASCSLMLRVAVFVSFLCQLGLLMNFKNALNLDDNRLSHRLLPHHDSLKLPIMPADDQPRYPHAGARHVDGRLGLVVDPSPKRLVPPLNYSTCQVGSESMDAQKVLEKVREGLLESQQRLVNQIDSSPPRILCLVYTHQGAHDNIRAIAQTWGQQCDGFIAASNQTDHSIGAIDLLHMGDESYDNMWQKIRSIWAYAYDHYRDQFDYFYLCGDDTYLVVDNLRAYLAGPDVDKLKNGHLDVLTRHNEQAARWKTERPRPLLFGLPSFFKGKSYPLGGCGYVLNRAALDLFVQVGLPSFLPNLTDPREDVFVGHFLWSQGVTTADFRDSAGAFRCQSMSADSMYNFDGHKSQAQPNLLRKEYGVEMLKGMDGVSRETTAFHLKSKVDHIPVAQKIHHYHMILNENVCSGVKSTLPENFVLYGNLSCPFESAKLSQSYMATVAMLRNLTMAAEQEEIHGMRRAQEARDFVLEHKTPQIFYAALTGGAFDGRRVLFEGDSLTRQLFTSVACLAWGSGYVESHEIKWKEWSLEEHQKYEAHFPGFVRQGQHSLILKGRVQLKGGGELVYDDRYPNPGSGMYKGDRPIQRLLDWTAACAKNQTISQDHAALTSKDIIIINAGLHPDRNKQFDAIKTLVSSCTGSLYPQFVYMLTPLQHFWTRKGVYDARMLNEEKETCQKTVGDFQRQSGDISHFQPLVPLLGEHLDQRDLGNLKIWHGDCTHWIMPGMHDVLSAELATILRNMTSESVGFDW